MEYQILVLLSNIFFIAAGYYLGKDAGVKSTIKAMDQVFNRIVDDINCGRSLDWLSEEKDSYK
tara:strand:- start:825 stop:1013 length:189 start_codon:yes stop_codon:yes gene_type:complete